MNREMGIPAIRDRLTEIVRSREDMPADLRTEIGELAEATRRKITKRSDRIVSTPITTAKAIEIRTFVTDHPRLTYHEVGRRFNVPGGRVSEIMHGKKGVRPS